MYTQKWLESGPGFARKLIRGFTLVELMIVVAIVALLMALAIPSYVQWVRKANRGEAQQLLLQWANNQEIWRANNATYHNEDPPLEPPTHARYDFYVRSTGSTCGNEDPTASTYVLVACAKSGNDQANDAQSGTSCTPLTLNQANLKLPAVCW